MKSYLSILLTSVTIALLGLFAFKRCESNYKPQPVIYPEPLKDTIYLEKVVHIPADTVYKTIVKTKTVIIDTSSFSLGQVIVKDSFIHDTIIERSVEYLPDPNGTLVVVDTVVDKQIVEVPVDKPKFKFYAGMSFSGYKAEHSGPMISIVHNKFQLSVIKPLHHVSAFEIAAQFRIGKYKK